MWRNHLLWQRHAGGGSQRGEAARCPSVICCRHRRLSAGAVSLSARPGAGAYPSGADLCGRGDVGPWLCGAHAPSPIVGAHQSAHRRGGCAEGCVRLTDGSINSRISAPVRMGRGVMADHFIVSSDSEVTDGALLDRCFVGAGLPAGQAVFGHRYALLRQLSSLSWRVRLGVRGPYSVTHHKGSLLIAGMFSFMNVGSSSNQSNHL